MKSYKNLYPKLCSYKNLEKALEKASKNKTSRSYVIEFTKNKTNNLLQLKKELETFTYKPLPLKKFIIQDPKTRVIRKSAFRDRVMHHAVVNILEPILDKTFIHDSYANRINKGTSAALKRLDFFKRKVTKNRTLIKHAKTNNMVKGYCLKADIKHFFDSVNHDVLIGIIRRKIKDNRVLWLVNNIIKNFDDKEKGMPLGNMTSQFFANVYLNDLDYFVKHKLKAKYYLRYVDDFVILSKNKEVLKEHKEKIERYLANLKLELHPNKSKIFSMYKGVGFLGFRIFYYYKLLRKRNLIHFNKKLSKLKDHYKEGIINYEKIMGKIQGWFAYAMWGNTYKLRKSIVWDINGFFKYNNE